MSDTSDKTSPGVLPHDVAAIEWAKAYPFDVPQQSFVYFNGEAHFLDTFVYGQWQHARIDREGQSIALSDVLGREGMAALERPRRHAVVACGSNAAPQRLAQKFRHTHDVVPTLRVTLENYCIVYSAKFSAYGSIPATLVHVPGACVTTFINFLDDRQLALMDETETLGVAYDRPVLEDAIVSIVDGATPKSDLASVFAYVSRSGALLKDGAAIALDTVEGRDVPFPKHSQEMVQTVVKDLLNVGDLVDNFIHQNLNDPSMRAVRAAELKKRWAKPFGVTLPVSTQQEGDVMTQTKPQLDEETQQRIEAAAFRTLVAHLQKRTDVQNIDLMNLAGFCRNCLSNWIQDAAGDQDITLSREEARALIYGMDYGDWKAKYQGAATPEQLGAFEKNKPSQ